MWSFSPLHEAILKQRFEVCSLLLSYKADPYLKNCYKKTAFDLALEQGELFSNKFNIEYLGYCLFEGIKDNDIFKIKKILNSESSLINFKHCRTYETPLHAASLISKRSEIVEILLKKGANLYAKNLDKQTPLHKAVESSNFECVEILLKSIKSDFMNNFNEYQSINNLINIHFNDSNAESPLHYAARLNSLPLCQLLITFGFDLNQRSLSDQFPHDLCQDQNIKLFLYGW